MTQTAVAIQQEEEDTLAGRFLTFRLGDETYGIEIKYVTEIVGMYPITKMPETPDYVKGVINLRGKVIPVIDMRVRFKKEEMEYNDRTCIVVVDIFDVSIGFIVDNVAEVLAIDEANIVPPPDVGSGIKNGFIKGIGKSGNEVKLLLDCEKLLRENELEEISSL